jgi:glutathione S-transferase
MLMRMVIVRQLFRGDIKMSIKLHHLNASRSQRLVWLLEELQLPHEIVHYTRDTQTNLAPASLLKIHPMGKSPLLEDDGVVIA